MKNIYLLTLVVCLATCALTAKTSAATFDVTTNIDTADANVGDGICADSNDQCSLRAAISEANAANKNSHVINLPAGLYNNDRAGANEDLNVGGDWDINCSVEIRGADRDTTILESGFGFDTGSERVLHLLGTNNLVEISNLTIRHGVQRGDPTTVAGQGGGIYSAGRLKLFNTVLLFNLASAGGGIYAPRELEITNSTIFANYCRGNGFCRGAGILMLHSGAFSLQINDSRFIGNSVNAGLTQGGAVSVQGTGTGVIRIENTLFQSNVSNAGGTSYGSGLFVAASGGHTQLHLYKTTFRLSEFLGGSQHHGTAMFVGTSMPTASITGAISSSTFRDNTGINGGALAISAAFGTIDLAVNDSLFTNNRARRGGAIAVYNIGPDTASSTKVSVTNSTFSANISRVIGGAAYVENSGAGRAELNFNFATLTANSAATEVAAPAGGGGGAIFHNSNNTGSVTLQNSVVAGNIVTGAPDAAPDISGTVNSLGYNHLGDLTGANVTGQTASNTLGPALLGSLSDNGGDTHTHLPLAGSPLIDSIPLGACTVNIDQRGFARPQGPACDRGAVEAGQLTTANISGTLRTAGGLPIRNIYVTIIGGNLPAPVTTLTSSFGHYSFANIPSGTYLITVASKRYSFSPDAISFTLTGQDETFDFNAEP